MTISNTIVTPSFVNFAGKVFYNGGAFGPDPTQFDITYTNNQTSGVQAIIRVGAAKSAPVGTDVSAFDADHLQWLLQMSINGATSISVQQFQTFADWHLTAAWEFVMWAITANNGTGKFRIGRMTNGFGPTAGGNSSTGAIAAVATDLSAVLASVRKTY